MLTARDAVADRIDGLDAGADDYLVKPFDVGELQGAAAGAAAAQRDDGDAGRRRVRELRLDAARHGVRVGETFVELTRTEYQLLELLMLNPGRVLPHALIYERVWGYDFGPASNALRVYVGYLRRKLEQAGARPLCTPCAASATSCASREPAHPHRRGRRAGGCRRRCWSPRRPSTSACRARAARRGRRLAARSRRGHRADRGGPGPPRCVRRAPGCGARDTGRHDCRVPERRAVRRTARASRQLVLAHGHVLCARLEATRRCPSTRARPRDRARAGRGE